MGSNVQPFERVRQSHARIGRAFEICNKTFEEIEGYDEIIALRAIHFESHCRLSAWIAPNGGVVGIRPRPGV